MCTCPGKLDPSAAHWIAGAIGVVRQHVWDVRIGFPTSHPTEAAEGARAVWLAQELRIPERHILERHRVETLAIVVPQDTESGITEPYGLLEHRVKHRGEVAGGRIDDLQYLGGRGLLLQGLARLGQEPRILDSDHRLRGEVLQ